jgi:hypothetical protein
MDDHKVEVYRFTYQTAGRDITPSHMWGTPAAIATLRDCAPLRDTERRIHRKLLDEAGFYFEQTPTAFETIEESARITSQ